MNTIEAIEARHSVRQYQEKAIPLNVIESLNGFIKGCNNESGLDLQLVVNEPKAFDSMMAHYGKFSGVTNYIALVGGKNKNEEIGYYGEKVVIEAQKLGLNSCWVAMTYKKIPSAFHLGKGKKLYMVIALGYGITAGIKHKQKPVEEVSNLKDDMPDWFKEGVRCALLAPTASNQEKFYLEYKDNKVVTKTGFGFYTDVDLGIVKYHFEVGSNKDSSIWEK